jgi:hypothetical protein
MNRRHTIRQLARAPAEHVVLSRQAAASSGVVVSDRRLSRSRHGQSSDESAIHYEGAALVACCDRPTQNQNLAPKQLQMRPSRRPRPRKPAPPRRRTKRSSRSNRSQSSSAARHKSFLFDATPINARRTGARYSHVHRGSGHYPASRPTDWRACVHRDAAQRRGTALDGGHNRQRG